MPETDAIATLAGEVVAGLIDRRLRVTTAESCTGGWISKALTDVAGSSGCFEYGFVTYSNEAKTALLGVRPGTLDAHGAVSEPVVREMAGGALAESGADIAVAVSGIAGPDGGTDAKPVGTVWFAWAMRSRGSVETATALHRLDGDREDVRSRSVVVALEGIRDRLGAHGE